MKKFFEHLALAFGGIAIVGLLIWVVMLLWNVILPDLTGWAEISYWQSAGLCLMFRLMTGHLGLEYKRETRNRRKHRHQHEKIHHKYHVGDDKSGIEVTLFSMEKGEKAKND